MKMKKRALPAGRRVFIVHGWDGSPKSDFIPWLKKELEAKGFEVHSPAMPNPEEPKIETWVPILAQAVGIVDENTFFVGHSVACQTILRFLESLPENKKVGGAVFVAGFFNLTNLEDKETEEIARPWIETPIDFEKVKSVLNKSIAIFSDNDPFVSLNNKDQFANKLGSKIIIEHNMSHFNEGAGITQLPSALNALLEIANNV